jgi:GDP-L-fucose synthase
MNSLNDKRIVVTGGAGFLGQAVCRVLRERGVSDEQITVPRRRDFDLTCETDVERLYDVARPDVVIHLAAEVGGIGANMLQPGRFFYANMAMGLHLVEHARRRGIGTFVHTGTVCAYPKHAAIPFQEDDLWSGYPEETNAPYGVAKKAIFVMLDGYQRQYGMKSAVVVPVNLYGPGDNFDPQSSHVIPALIRKCEEARLAGNDDIVCWGTGSATREFLYVDDAAEGIVRAAEVMEEPVPINLGGGREIAIRDLVGMIARACDFDGTIRWDTSKPDGQPRRSLDISRARSLLGWEPQMDFDRGLAATVAWWRQQTEARSVTV